MKALELNETGLKTSDEIRHCPESCQLRGSARDTCTRLLWLLTDAIVVKEHNTRVLRNPYRWFTQELGECLRTRTGSDLSFHLELTMRRWVDLGLDWGFMQTLLAAVWERFRQAGAQKVEVPAEPKPPEKADSALAECTEEDARAIVNAT